MISQHDQQRIDRIQTEVNFHRDALTDLLTQIKDEGAREQIQTRLNWVNDIETLYLRSARTEPRYFPGQLSRWLDFAETHLHAVVVPQVEQIRKFYIERIQKYGANFQTVQVV